MSDDWFREYKDSLAVGSLSGILALLLLPLSIWYVAGLASFMPPKLGLHVLFGFFGSYIWPQSLGYALLAGILHYSWKIAAVTQVNTRKQVRFGLAGALYSTVISYFSICCAPIAVTLIGVLGSGPALILLVNSGKLAILGLLIQAIAIGTALRTIVRYHRNGIACKVKPSSDDKEALDASNSNFKLSNHNIRARPNLTRITILGLFLGVILVGGSVAASPDFEEKRPTINAGAIEVHILDTSGQFVKDGLVVKIIGPIEGVASTNGYIARFDPVPPGEYKVEIEGKDNLPQFVNLREGGEEHVFIRLNN